MAEEKAIPRELSISAQIEALLFVAPSGVTTSQLAGALKITPREVEKGLNALQEAYAQGGIRMQRHKGEIRLTSAPEMGGLVQRFLSL
ncbi:MAG: SMC-Scp complex subunit ScpB, partial [Chloroflexi bacterium]|nr:SMC-Scp complex subunit ScpB [Chloroflexota bacterium]